MGEDIAGVAKQIDDYQKDIVKNQFFNGLATLLKEAQIKKNAEPRTDETRHWAVVYTDLEKVQAYADKFLGAK